MTRTPREHPIVYLYCNAISALLLYVPGFVVAAYGRLWVGYDLRQPRTMIDRVPAYARRATWAHENSFEAFALFAAAALMAYVTGLDGAAATSAAVLHPIARFLFQLFYIADRPALRGAMYLTGLLCSATLIALSLIRVGREREVAPSTRSSRARTLMSSGSPSGGWPPNTPLEPPAGMRGIFKSRRSFTRRGSAARR